MKNLFIFLGAPGSGKGSLSRICVERLGWTQLSTGDLCRRHISDQTEIGKKIDFAIKSGKLVADSLIADMVEDAFREMAESAKPIILDGYPRTVVQAQFLHDFLKKNDKKFCLRVIRFVISDAKLVDRLSKRLVCQNKQCQAIYTTEQEIAPSHQLICSKCGGQAARREDDKPEVVKKRLAEYGEHEQALLCFYASIDQPVVELVVDKPLNQVFEDFKRLVGVKDV